MNLICAATIIVNLTQTWTALDQKNLEFAQKRCRVHYSESPCAKKFVKKAERTYNVICGGKDASQRGKDTFLKNPSVF